MEAAFTVWAFLAKTALIANVAGANQPDADQGCIRATHDAFDYLPEHVRYRPRLCNAEHQSFECFQSHAYLSHEKSYYYNYY